MIVEKNVLPPAVRALRAGAYQEMLSLGTALGLKTYFVRQSFAQAGEGWGLAYVLADYKRLTAELEPLLDNAYFHLAHAESEPEYPFPQMRLCLNGTSMEAPLTAHCAMHQGIYINLYLLAAPAFIPGLQERAYRAVQEKILALLDRASEQRIDEQLLLKLIRKRQDIMEGEAEANSRTKHYQIFPCDPADYKLGRLALEKPLPPETGFAEDEDADWQGYEFNVPTDLLEKFESYTEMKDLHERSL